MSFNVIVHAPTLRAGARLNIAQADQTVDDAPERLSVGSEIKLRFGVCCPDKAEGRIIDLSPEPETAMLAVGTQVWPLRKGTGGVATGGLVSEHWYVSER